MIYMFLSNNPSSGDINSSNLSCLELFSFVKQIAGLIEEHLVLGPTYHGSTGFKNHLPSQVPA